MDLKQDSVHFQPRPRGAFPKLRLFPLTGYVFQDFFLCPKQGQGFKPLAANINSSTRRVAPFPRNIAKQVIRFYCPFNLR